MALMFLPIFEPQEFKFQDHRKLDAAWSQARQPSLSHDEGDYGARRCLQQQKELRKGARTSHSRSSTMTSSTSEGSMGTSSLPESQHSRNESYPLTPPKKEGSAKTLLSKSNRMLRRQGSKFSLLSSPTSRDKRSDLAPPSTPASPDAKNHGIKTSLGDIKRDILKRTISEPFRFQHVTHTNRAHFDNLDRVNNNELISEFSAIRAGQKADAELRGIHAECLRAPIQSPEVEDDRLPTTPTTPTVPCLPLTPPRPSLPPKDSAMSPLSSMDIRSSTSVDNFSRPVPRSPLLPVTPPPRQSHSSSMTPSTDPRTPACPLSSVDMAEDTAMRLPSTVYSPIHVGPQKPLPGLPALRQQSSTWNQTLTPMMTTAPTKPSGELAYVLEEEDNCLMDGDTQDPMPAPGAMSLSQLKPDPSTSEDPTVLINASGSVLPVDGRECLPHDADAQVNSSSSEPSTPHANRSDRSTAVRQRRSRISIGLKTIDVHDWEDAVDYSWDHDAEADFGSECIQSGKQVVGTQALHFDVEKSLDVRSAMLSPTITAPFERQPVSASATTGPGLMMASSRSATGTSSDVQPELSAAIYNQSLRPRGLEPANRIRPDQDLNAILWSNHSGVPAVVRPKTKSHYSATGGVSKSSSQESIILSIASSLMSTQRSSTSSASMTDITSSMNSIKEQSTESFSASPTNREWDSVIDSYLAAAENNTPTTPNDHSFHSTSGHEISNQQPHQFHLPRRVSRARARSHADSLASCDKTTSGNTDQEAHKILLGSHSQSTSPMHTCAGSGSRISVPIRTSSIAEKGDAPEVSSGQRHRAATMTPTKSRSRHTSTYSLFPCSTPGPT